MWLHFIFYRYDTLSATAAIALYYLATNPEVQEKAATEAIEASEKEMNSGKISREELSELTYLDNVLSEALRMAAVPIIFK